MQLEKKYVEKKIKKKITLYSSLFHILNKFTRKVYKNHKLDLWWALLRDIVFFLGLDWVLFIFHSFVIWFLSFWLNFKVFPLTNKCLGNISGYEWKVCFQSEINHLGKILVGILLVRCDKFFCCILVLIKITYSRKFIPTPIYHK